MYSEDGACRSVEVAAGATARHVCEMLVQRAHALSDESWGLVESHPYLALGELRYKELCGHVFHLGPIGAPLYQSLFFTLYPRAGSGRP